MYNISREKITNRFLKYVQIDTTSIPNSKNTPSSLCQFDLARILYQELIDLGASDVYLDEENCLVYARIKASKGCEGKIKTAFIAHMDTSSDVSGKDVKPWVYHNYDGKDVKLNDSYTLKVEEFPNILNYLGCDIIFTDGTTLLGGDDKAAISEIMTMCEILLNNEDILHGEIEIAFTPDEEVGGLAKDLDFERLGADIAYTVDGDSVGYFSDETFNATEARIIIKGKNVHPGTAYGIMKNALEIGCEIIDKLPNVRPYNTKDRVGYFHPHKITGSVEECELLILIRDHEKDLFLKKIDMINQICEDINQKYGFDTIKLEYNNSYSSMKEVVDKYPFMIEELVNAIKDTCITPHKLAFRGGTDGSSISARGLPCPNISAGYENGHSRYEFVPIESMVKITNILINLVKRLNKVNKK